MSAAAVDGASAQLANTTLNEPTATAEGASVGTGGAQPINAAQNEAVIQSAAEGRRLYIGNLAYATTEGELKDFFKDYLIETVSIPLNPRTTKPVGYAFVDVSTASEGERAIAELNKKTILDREVSVQLARKPEESSAAAAGGEGQTKRRNSGRGRGKSGRGRGPRGARSGRGEKEGEAPANGVIEPLPLTEATNTASTTEAQGAEKDSDGKAGAAARPRRTRGPPEDGVASKTKIMVANLPYDLAEEKLLEVFKDYSPTSAKLALRPIPRFMIKKLQARNEPRKGRGFAFVTMPTEELQQKAIAEMNGKEIDGRELAVKVAIDSPGKEEDALNAQADAEGAKENGSPAPNATEQATAAA